MSDARLTQPSFTAGEIAPALWARKDLARYQVGCRKLENCFVHAHGGASNRSGFKFVGEVKDSTKGSRLTTFEAAADDAFLLVWGDNNVRPVFLGGYVDAGGGVPYEIVTPYAHTELADIYMEQSNDIATITHPLYPIQELARYSALDWRLSSVDFASQVPPPTDMAATVTEGYTGYDGSHLKKFYTYKVAAIGANGEEGLPSLPFQSNSDVVLGYEQNFITLTWTPLGAGYVGSAVPVGKKGSDNETQYNLSFKVPNDRTVTAVGVWSSDAKTGMRAKIARRVSAGNYTTVVDQAFNHPGGGWFDCVLTTPYVVPSTNNYYLGCWAATGLRETDDIPQGWKIGNVSGVGSGFSEGNGTAVSIRALLLGSGSDVVVNSYNVYKEQNGLFGLIGGTDGTSFKDTNFSPSFSNGPQTGENPFVGDGNYPSIVSFVQQRRVFARSLNAPQTIWETQSANYANMGTSTPVKDDDALTFTLASQRKQDIYHIIPLEKGMIVFTRSGEWKVTGRDGDVITPSSIYPQPQSQYGSSKTVHPLVIRDQILFPPRGSNSVLELGYSLEADRYVANDLSLLSTHLFKGRTIVAWDFASVPHGIVYVVMSDGNAITLTYLKEHDVWGWAQMTTRGQFKDVAVVPEGGRDVPYFLIERRVSGVKKTYIEFLEDREYLDIRDAFFVDCGLTLDVPLSITSVARGATTVVTSPAHGLANGQYVEIDGLKLYDVDDNVSQPLDGVYTVSNVTTNTFRLKWEYDNSNAVPAHLAGGDVDSTAFSGLFYDGGGMARKGVMTISGLGHIEGRTVAILADGNVVDPQVVTAGSLPSGLPNRAFRVHVGLPYRSTLGTLDLLNSQGDDTGITKAVPQVAIRLDKTRGVKVGRTEASAVEDFSRDYQDYGSPALLKSGLFTLSLWEEWSLEQPIYVVQDYPLPMTVLGITLGVDYGGTGAD